MMAWFSSTAFEMKKNWLGLLAVRAVDDEHGTADFGGGSGDEGLIGCIVEQSVSSKIFSFSFCSFSAFPS